MIDPLYKLKTICTEQRNDLSEHLARGGVADYPAYCKAVGAVQTLDLVLAEIAELERRMAEE
jgi:hypothetical protein